jgi:hypothetical protein
MKKFITLASAGLLLFSLQTARAQQEVEPPAVPPMLEGSRPLAQPETREPAAPKQPDVGKAKPKTKAKPTAKTGKKTQKKATAKKENAKKENAKKPGKVAKKKSLKTQKKKPPETAPQPETAPKQQAEPEEG